MKVSAVLMVVTMLVLSKASAEQRNPGNMAALLAPRTTQAVQAMVPEGVRWVPDIAYRDGHPLWKLDLAMPRIETDTPRPAIVIIHGGGWKRGDKRANIWARYPLEYAKAGFVAISVNYRLLPDDPFPASVEDVKAAVRWLRENAGQYNIDVNRIGAYGNSAGAHLALMLAFSDDTVGLAGPYTAQTASIQAVAASAPPTDLVNWSSKDGSVEALTMSSPSTARLASPLYHVTKNSPPVLLFHGTNDNTVPYDQSTRLIKALLDVEASDVALRSFEASGHGAYIEHIKETLPMSIQFFSRVLQP